MSLDPGLEGNDPTVGENAGANEPSQGTPATPAGRSYTDADMAGLRRSLQADSKRELERLRQDLAQQYAPRPQQNQNDPWSKLDPQVAEVFKGILEHEMSTRFSPIKEQQEDIAFRNDEAEIRSQYPDYGKNRVAVLEYGVEHGISDLGAAYRAWKYDELSTVDPKKIGDQAVSAYLAKAKNRANNTPAVEGRGGGAPSSKQKFKNREEMDDAALALIQSMNNE